MTFFPKILNKDKRKWHFLPKLKGYMNMIISSSSHNNDICLKKPYIKENYLNIENVTKKFILTASNISCTKHNIGYY